MENYSPTIRGSVMPSRLPTPAAPAALGKRTREADSTPQSKRLKKHTEVVEVKPESEVLINASSSTRSATVSGTDSKHDPAGDSAPGQAALNVIDNLAPIDSATAVRTDDATGDIVMQPPSDDGLTHPANFERRTLC